MKLKRVYLVEFRLWRKARRRKKDLWRQSQLDLPGLPDYGPNGRPEIEARLISNLAEESPSMCIARDGVGRFWPKWQVALPVVPFLLIPLLSFRPRLFLVLSFLALVAAAATRVRVTRVKPKT